MLLKRLDVTIKAFLWGKQVEGREEEVSSALSAQRVELSEEPKSITVRRACFIRNYSLFVHMAIASAERCDCSTGIAPS